MINLLPPLQKEELFREQRYKLLLIWGLSIIIFLITLSLLLFSISTFISGKAQEEKIAIPPELQDSEKEITQINKSLRNLNSFYNKQPDFGELLERIYKMLPPDVYLTSLSLNFSEKEESFSVSLQGFSPTRELLSQLKRNLESEPGFKDIDFPPLNWVKPDKIDFNLSFKAKI